MIFFIVYLIVYTQVRRGEVAAEAVARLTSHINMCVYTVYLIHIYVYVCTVCLIVYVYVYAYVYAVYMIVYTQVRRGEVAAEAVVTLVSVYLIICVCTHNYIRYI